MATLRRRHSANDERVVHHAERDDYIVVRFATRSISSESGCTMEQRHKLGERIYNSES